MDFSKGGINFKSKIFFSSKNEYRKSHFVESKTSNENEDLSNNMNETVVNLVTMGLGKLISSSDC